MARFGTFIAPSARLGLTYAEKLLQNVTPENYSRFACPAGLTIKSNHAAFILGHLSLYPVRVMRNLDLPPGPTVFPPKYEPIFKFGVECQDDPGGKVYPPLVELKTFFFDAYRAAVAAVEQAPDERFDAPNPAEGPLRELFPTVGSAINFYLIGHVQVHLGQFSTWRRAMGLPPA